MGLVVAIEDESIRCCVEQLACSTGRTVQRVVSDAVISYIKSHNTVCRTSSKARNEKEATERTLYISAPIVDLVKGLLHGHETVGTVLQHGDFGLGTLDMLDGEMVVMDGVAYQQTANGTCVVVDKTALTPFMMVTRFDSVSSMTLPIKDASWSQLQHTLLEALPSSNLFFAIKISGAFDSLHLRAVKKQEKDRPLVEVTREQTEFKFSNTKGNLIGFWSPEFLGHAMTVPGFHLHFVSEDKQHGGHVLDLHMTDGVALIDPIYHFEQGFPKSDDFTKADLSVEGIAEQLKEAEN